jgi:hypothetical protein
MSGVGVNLGHHHVDNDDHQTHSQLDHHDCCSVALRFPVESLDYLVLPVLFQEKLHDELVDRSLLHDDFHHDHHGHCHVGIEFYLHRVHVLLFSVLPDDPKAME